MKQCNSQYHEGNNLIEETLFTSKYHKNICKFCLSKIRKKEREKNKDRVRKEQKAWRENNKEHIRNTDKEYRESEEGKSVRQKSYERNREQKREYDRKRRQEVSGVREKYNASSARYRAAKIQAVPLWFEKDTVDRLYAESQLISEQSGIEHHVDHIVPLQNNLVCGLHCKDNLQIITALSNITKGNKFKIN